MGASEKLGLLYVFKGDVGALESPQAFLSSAIAPALTILGEDVFWFGWNDWRICLPARTSISELAQEGKLPQDLSYLRIFSEAAEFVWQWGGGSRPLARLCTEIEGERELIPQFDGWAVAHDGVFECRPSERILMGTPPSGGEAKIKALFEVRYPRPFIYPGIECGKGKRVKATVFEYLDRATWRLCLTRYCSIHSSGPQEDKVKGGTALY